MRVEVHNNFDDALRQLKRKLMREGIIKEMRLRQFYESPGQKRRRERAAAIARNQREERKRMDRDGF